MNKFEEIRYSDRLIAKGGGIGIAMEGKAVSGKHLGRTKHYHFTIRDLDRFVCKLAQLVSVNPASFTTMHLKQAQEACLRENPEMTGWFARRL